MTKISTKKSCGLAALTRKLLCFLCVGMGLLLLGHPVPASAAPADGTIELSGGKVAAGVGYSWGSGTLIFKGKRYPLNINGISLGSVGIDEYTGSGTVTGLRTARDINGIFTAVGTGLTLGRGANIAEMRNENGVTIQLDSTIEGLSVSLAAKGVEVSIAE
jgi:hypothetical protein